MKKLKQKKLILKNLELFLRMMETKTERYKCIAVIPWIAAMPLEE